MCVSNGAIFSFRMNVETPNLVQESQQYKESSALSSNIPELIEKMCSVDLEDKEALINAYSISDGKGGRIYL